MRTNLLVIVLALCLVAVNAGCQSPPQAPASISADTAMAPVPATEAEWRTRLTPPEYNVLRQSGTEAPYTHPFWNATDVGLYSCKGCGHPLFVSDSKFTSHCGWPSFFQPLDSARLEYVGDTSHGMDRTEVRCARCHSHLGHVFEDGPRPTGLRYCINGTALDFTPSPPGR